MARIDTLPHFLTDVADAIRTKKGTSETITASNFDTEITNLPSGSTQPKSLSELLEQFADVGDSFENYINDARNRYNYSTTENVTLYTPDANYKNYIIRYRNNVYQVVWFPNDETVFARRDNTLLEAKFYYGYFDNTHSKMVDRPVNYALSGNPIDGYVSNTTTSTLEEAVNLIKSNQTTYTKLSADSNWGYKQYSDDYLVPYTNTPFIEENGSNTLTMQRISSNETIEVIE